MTVYAKHLYRDSNLIVVILESITVDSYQSPSNMCGVVGRVGPIAILICGPESNYALDMDTNAIGLDRLRRQVPELNSIVNPLISPYTLLDAPNRDY